MAGWSEKILDIDLNTQTYKTYPLDMEMAQLFIGGVSSAPFDHGALGRAEPSRPA